MESLKRYILTHKYLLVAHRGSSGTAPENTLAAYRKALDIGIPAIEIDIHLTKDSKIVAFHDDHLGRTSAGNKSIEDSTLEELRQLEVGSWFSDEFKSEKIPTLEEIIALVQDKAYLIIELKPFPKFPEVLINKLLEILTNSHFINKTILVSFDYSLLKQIKNINEFFLTAAIKIPDQDVLPSHIFAQCSADGIICSIEELDERISKDSYENRIPLAVYDVDSEDMLNKALSYNVRGIGTNYPEMILKLLNITENL
jgi:glycerophosphoryl diester phosphodiesterase